MWSRRQSCTNTSERRPAGCLMRAAHCGVSERLQKRSERVDLVLVIRHLTRLRCEMFGFRLMKSRGDGSASSKLEEQPRLN